MAVNPIALCADLQPWHGAGLSLLYFSDADNLQALLSSPSRPMPALRRDVAPMAEPAAIRQPLQQNAQTDPVAKFSSKPPLFPSGPGLAGNAQSGAISPKPGSAAMRSFTTDVEPLDAAKLPPAWQALMSRLKPAPVIWTYAELGQDLLVQGDPKRSAALKRMIGGLRLPAGSSSFLPVQAPDLSEEQRAMEPRIFQQMLHKLQGKVLVVLGSDALEHSAFGGLGLACFQERVFDGRLVLCLPALSELQGDSAKMDATVVYLRTALSKINL